MWLGSASLAAKLLDALTGFLLIGLLSKSELGLATMAWTVTTFVEAFNGIGVGAALVQAPRLDARAMASAHWYAVLTSILFSAALVALAPVVAGPFDSPEVVRMVQVSGLKLAFVGLANVPLALASRNLRFERLGAIATLATLASSFLTMLLAVLGLGAWAPLLGNTAHGAFQLLGACILVPFFPRPQLSWKALKPLARMGWSLTGAGAAGQVARNLDYLMLGWFGGASALGGYRVAFDLAMAPTQALLQVVNRFSLPVYARVAAAPAQLGAAIGWTARNALLLVGAPVLVAFVMADDLFRVLGKAGDAGPIAASRLLCGAALVRALGQVQVTAIVASGRSRLVLMEALASAALLAACLGAALLLLGGFPTEVRLAVGWLLAMLLLAPLDWALLRTVLPGVAGQLLRSIRTPLLVAMGVGLLAHLIGSATGLPVGVTRLVVGSVCTLALYALGMRYIAGVRWSDLRRARPKQ
jgi:O-antigen/teichoic acid export membrane protein